MIYNNYNVYDEYGGYYSSSKKKNIKCKDWPSCTRGDSCYYHHPSESCPYFPACKYGDDCLYIHPNVPH